MKRAVLKRPVKFWFLHCTSGRSSKQNKEDNCEGMTEGKIKDYHICPEKFIRNKIICISLEKVCEAPRTLKTVKEQVESILFSTFSSFSNLCSHFMAREVCIPHMMAIRGQGV